MNKLNIYILVTITLFLLSVPILAYVGETRLDVYYSTNLLLYLISTELLLPFKPKYRRRIALIESVLVALFIVIVAKRIIEILGL